MSYILIEYNNYICVKLKEITYPYAVIGSCENFGLSDLVKFSTCKNIIFLMPFYGTHCMHFCRSYNHMCLVIYNFTSCWHMW